jgi:predicted RND superfamily exporter protein
MEKYAELFARGRLPVIAFAVLMSALAVFGLTRVQFDDVPRRIFANDDPDYAQLLSLYEDFGSDDNDVIVVLEADDWFRPETFELLRTVAERSSAVAGVDSVLWLGDVPFFDGLLPRPLVRSTDDLVEARARTRAHPLVAGRLLSDDGRVTLVVARLDEDFVAIDDVEPPVIAMRAFVDELDGRGGVRASVTGIPPIRVDIYNVIQSDQVRFFIIGGVLCWLLALVLFRSLGAVICTTTPPLIGALWAYGFIGLAGQSLDILSGILSMLVIVIALTDSIHLMIDVRISRANGATAVQSAVDAIRHLGVPCALTSLTTAVGFGSLALADVPAIRRFGFLAAGSVVMAFLAVITVMPLMVSLFPRVGASRMSRSDMSWSRRAIPVIGFVMRFPRAIAVAGILASVALLFASMQLVPDNRLTEALPHDEAFHALERCEEAFGGVLPSYVLIEWEEGLELASPEVRGTIAEVADFLSGIPSLGRPLSVLDLLASVPGGTESPAAALALIPEDVSRRLIRPDLRKALVMAPVPDAEGKVMRPLLELIREGLASIAARHEGRFALTITGTDVVARASVNRMIDDLARSLAFAACVIFGVIAIEFRSLRLGLISLVPNLFPLVLVGGTLHLLGLPLQMASAVLFTVLLGLAVDDTIHFLARHRRETALAGPGADPRAVLESTYSAVGRAIVITTLVLAVGFLTVAMSSVPTNQLFALLSCLGLGGALIGDLLLLPALLYLFARDRGKLPVSAGPLKGRLKGARGQLEGD